MKWKEMKSLINLKWLFCSNFKNFSILSTSVERIV